MLITLSLTSFNGSLSTSHPDKAISLTFKPCFDVLGQIFSLSATSRPIARFSLVLLELRESIGPIRYDGLEDHVNRCATVLLRPLPPSVSFFHATLPTCNRRFSIQHESLVLDNLILWNLAKCLVRLGQLDRQLLHLVRAADVCSALSELVDLGHKHGFSIVAKIGQIL